MGQHASKKKLSAGVKTGGTANKVATRKVDSGGIWQVVPERPYNICGILENDYLISGIVADAIERDFLFYHLYRFQEGDSNYVSLFVVRKPTDFNV